MPSTIIIKNFESMNELRPHQNEFLQLAKLAGIHMDNEIFRSLVQLLNMGVGADAVFNLLKTMRKRKMESGRSRRSSAAHRVHATKQK